MSNLNKHNIDSLSKEEIKSILEALLFASSVDVVANWYKDNALMFLNVAKKLRSKYPDVLLESVYVYDHEKTELNDEHTSEIIEYFPELKKEKSSIKELAEIV
jgi:hypothetical protein